MDKSPKICQILFDVDDEYKDSNLSFAVNYIAAHNFVQLSYTVVKYNEDWLIVFTFLVLYFMPVFNFLSSH